MAKDLVPKEEYDQILKWINSDDSVVGIDARETHIIIIHKLMKLEKKISKLGKKIKQKKKQKKK